MDVPPADHDNNQVLPTGVEIQTVAQKFREWHSRRYTSAAHSTTLPQLCVHIQPYRSLSGLEFSREAAPKAFKSGRMSWSTLDESLFFFDLCGVMRHSFFPFFDNPCRTKIGRTNPPPSLSPRPSTPPLSPLSRWA